MLENCTFHKPAMKWTIEYISENLQDEDHVAYFSKNRYDRMKRMFINYMRSGMGRSLKFLRQRTRHACHARNCPLLSRVTRRLLVCRARRIKFASQERLFCRYELLVEMIFNDLIGKKKKKKLSFYMFKPNKIRMCGGGGCVPSQTA